MSTSRFSLLLVPVAAVMFAACEAPRSAQSSIPTEPSTLRADAAIASSSRSVVASGLLYPRGMAFGSDGALYVAEAGTPWGNTTFTGGECLQVPAPQGPHRGGYTGRISRIGQAGTRVTVASGLPSAADPGGNVVGISDLAFVGDRLYGLLVAGCSQGNLDVPASVLRVEQTGGWSVAADLSAWVKANPVASPNEEDFEPDGDWYGMVSAGGILYATDANQGSLVAIVPASGRISRVADLSATQGHVVPTGVAVHQADVYVGELTTFPAQPGAAKVLRYRRNGQLVGALSGFTAITAVDVDARGNVYVLESFTCASTLPCFPSPGSGRVMRVAADGTRSVAVSGLSFATAMRLGPDGAIYVSNFGYGPPAAGEIVRVAADAGL